MSEGARRRKSICPIVFRKDDGIMSEEKRNPDKSELEEETKHVEMPKMWENIYKNPSRSLLWESPPNSIGIHRFTTRRNTRSLNRNDDYITKQCSGCKLAYIMEYAVL